MAAIHQEIKDLQASIQESREKAAHLQLQLDALRLELTDLKAQYDRTVLPAQKRLETARAELIKLEQDHLIQQQPVANWTPAADYVPVEEQYRQSWVTGEKTTTLKEEGYPEWTPPDDYVPVEEQYRRKWTPQEPGSTPADFIPPPPEPAPSDHDLKTLYRHLARRYHPDYAENEQDTVFRTQMMAQINEAYAAEDIDALRALFTQDTKQEIHYQSRESVEELQLKQLRIVQHRLRRQVFALKQHIHDLEHSDLMRLKHEMWMSRLHGRDLLKDMAEDIERECHEVLRKVYRLRRHNASGI